MFHWLGALLAHQGYWVIFFVIFINNLGLPIPGDSMLLGGGFLAGKGILAGWAVVLTGMAACFLGGNGSYWIGLRYSRRFFLKEMGWFRVTPKRVKQAEYFFEKYGAKAVFFARFVSLLHPVTGLLAGMGKTPLRPFLFYNFAGAGAYALLYTLAGYFFGQRWEHFKSGIGPVALYGILVAVALLVLFLFLRHSIRGFFAGFHQQTPRTAARRADRIFTRKKKTINTIGKRKKQSALK
jgi:membrane protein DedA with SNARE-associated domain